MLTEKQIASHTVAQKAIDEILDEGWKEIGRRLRPANGKPGKVTEFDMVQWFSEGMKRANLVWENGPNVSVNANCSDSHYEPTADHTAESRTATSCSSTSGAASTMPTASSTTSPGPASWAASPPSASNSSSKPSATPAMPPSAPSSRPSPTGRAIRGFEADDAARAVIRAAGFADYFTHRTGHNIAHEIHGPGAHLDNLETHDVRQILPNTCFSVEPGIYLPEFGVRSEIDMITAPGKAWVTGKIQRELVRI